MFNQIKNNMKKTLFLGTALALSIAGFSQSTAKKAINPKYLMGQLNYESKTLDEGKPSTTPGIKINKKGHASTMASCNSAMPLTTSYNCNGVGGGPNTSPQNCLTYNSDLNVLAWTQRGSKTWNLITTSGFIQTTLISTITGQKIDSIITYADANTTHHARYPGGVLLNPITNTSGSYTNAIAIGLGVCTDNTNWIGTAYAAKPLWSVSALTHSAPTGDSLYTPSAGGKFGFNCNALKNDAPPTYDAVALPDRKTVISIGAVYSQSLAAIANADPIIKALIAKGTLDNTGKIVNWTVDSSLAPNVFVGSLGSALQAPRIAFGPDGMHGYVIFIGRLATAYGNKSDSAMTPIVYKTTDAGATWTQVLQGYDWMCKHPEVSKNVGELTGRTDNFSFDQYGQGSDLTVDANNVLHYVTSVTQPFHNSGTIDSMGVYSYSYDYDNAHHHAILWDFMTDGTEWRTMMVDSVLSASCSSSTTDTTNTASAMGGAAVLGVAAHVTVSRSTDGAKVFYGWADSDPGVLGVNATGATYNTNPDILMKALDVNTGMVSATKNVTGGLGTCFYPFLADQSYSDGAGGWVVPAVYTVGDNIIAQTPQVTYDASSQVHYLYTDCGTFVSSDYTIPAPVYIAPTGSVCTALSIKANNTFESSVSNYPNPFNGTTTIAVTLSENKAFNVNVYNAIGTLVFSKKVNGNVGENAVSFDGSALSAGVYYYTVTAGNQQATKKMIIQK
jgi:hypothetical protein